MRYHEPVFRPPSEAHSLLIQATIGCPHNKCAFCAMYKGVKFRLRPVQEIKEDIDEAREMYGKHVRTMFFPDGNTICMKTDRLVDILEYSREKFSLGKTKYIEGDYSEATKYFTAAGDMFEKSSQQYENVYQEYKIAFEKQHGTFTRPTLKKKGIYSINLRACTKSFIFLLRAFYSSGLSLLTKSWPRYCRVVVRSPC